MPMQRQVTSNFELHVRVSYVEKESRPESGFYFFSYHVRVTNKGAESAQLMSRHWVITDAMGQVEEVRGAGVVGLQPHLAPGQTFEYDSACPLTTASGSMKGSYQMLSKSGESFDIEIPEFYLVAPAALH